MKFNKIGTGYPIIFIHGWAMNYEIFLPFIEMLEKDKYQIIMFDLPTQSRINKWDDLISLINNEIDKLKLKSFDLFGWSLGGHIAMDLYYKNKSKINKLFLISSTPKFTNTKEWIHGLDKEVFNTFAFGIKENREKYLNRFFNLQLLGLQNKKKILNFIKSNVSKDISKNNNLIFYLNHMIVSNYQELLKNISAKVFIIAGAKDKIVPIKSQYEMLKLIKNVDYLFINDATHLPFLSHSETCKKFMNNAYE
jgi:pimeloyl-[acyl-carrier protein] methyl ester esterase